MTAWYNDTDPYCCAWLRNLISEGLIADGHVDDRSIADVTPGDLAGFSQCHFFAGIGGWPYAARLAGWPDERGLWTGSAPCQPFSVAGKGAGQADARHLWPDIARLIGACRPPVFVGEQVAAAVGKSWFDGVRADLEGVGYAVRGVVVPACAVDAPHRRDRLWFVADSQHGRCEGRDAPRRGSGAALPPGARAVADADGPGSRAGLHDPAARHWDAAAADDRQGALGHAEEQRSPAGAAVASADVGADQPERPGAWSTFDWLEGADGKRRRVEPGIRLLAHGVPARVAKLRAFGNAIVPQVAAEILKAYLECCP